MTRSSFAPLFGIIALFALGCSDAEVPAAYDGGPLQQPLDGGPDLSNLDQPCPTAACGSNALVCVDRDGAPGTTDDRYCRLKCDRNEPGDPCGEGSRCLGLEDGSAACQPAGRLDEPCPCDDGFACVDEAGNNVCKVSCDPNGDGSECEDDEQCAAFETGPGGACVE